MYTYNGTIHVHIYNWYYLYHYNGYNYYNGYYYNGIIYTILFIYIYNGGDIKPVNNAITCKVPLGKLAEHQQKIIFHGKSRLSAFKAKKILNFDESTNKQIKSEQLSQKHLIITWQGII